MNKLSINCICKNCRYNQGIEEYEEGKSGIFCNHPDIIDYLDGEPTVCDKKKFNILKLIAVWDYKKKPKNTKTYEEIPPEERDNNSWWYLHGKLTDLVGYDKAISTNCKSGGFSKETINWSEIEGNVVTSLSNDFPTSQICIDGIVDVEIEEIEEPCVGYFWTTNNRLIYWEGKPYDYWEQRGLVCLKSDIEGCKYAKEKYEEKSTKL